MTCDPIYELKIDKCSTLFIKYDLEPLSQSEISSIIEYKNKILANVDGIKYQIKKKLNQKSIQLPVYDDLQFVNKEHTFIEKDKITHKDFDDSHKKVLFVVHSGEKHGPVFLIRNFIKTAKKKFGIDPIILVLTNDIIRDQFEELGYVFDLDLNYFDINLRKNIIDDFLKNLINIGCNDAICNDLTTGIIADSLKENGFIVTQLVHELPELVRFNNLSSAAKVSFDYADKFVFLSKYVNDRFIEEGIYKKGDKYVSHHAVYNVDLKQDFQHKVDAKRDVATKLGFYPDCKIVIGCGTGFLVKGVDLFVGTAIKILEEMPETQFVWIGHFDNAFDYMGRVLSERHISIFEKQKNIHLLDFVENPDDYFAASDIYFCSSRNDAIPASLLEALAAYNPSVVFEDSGGAPELVKTDYNGAVVGYGDIEAAAMVIKHILLDEKYRKQLALNAHESVKDYTMENYVKRIFTICNLM